MIIGDRLRTLREARNLSQPDIEKRSAIEPLLADRGKPPELPNLPKRVSVDELLQTRLIVTVKRAWRKLRRPAAA
jgi:transcriptional regulator with XRE-family HTH domain